MYLDKMAVHRELHRTVERSKRFGGLFSWDGCEKRMEYISGTIIYVSVCSLASWFIAFLFQRCGSPMTCSYAFSPLYVFNVGLVLASLFAMLCQRIRRFHDFGMPGWSAIATTPAVPILLWLWLGWPEVSHFDGLIWQAPSAEATWYLRRFLLFVIAVFIIVPTLAPSTARGQRYNIAAHFRKLEGDQQAREQLGKMQ